MTRDEIMSMSAEELRMAIAKVKGYEYYLTPSNEVYLTTPQHLPLMQRGTVKISRLPEGCYIWCQAPDYPHDIAAAWELIGEMGNVELIKDSVAWQCLIYSLDDKEDIHVVDDTAPLAICRARLMLEESKDE